MKKYRLNSCKKAAYLMVIGSFLYSIAFSQIPLPQRKEEYNIKNFQTKIIETKSSKEKINFLNINSIEIVDARPDTLAIGLAQQNNQRPFFIVFDQDFTSEVQQFVNTHSVFAKSDSLSVKMVIKKFWISGGLDDDVNEQVRKTGYADTSSEKIANLQVRIEFFLERGSVYYILYRFDSTFRKNIMVSKNASELVPPALEASLFKLSGMDPNLPSIMANKKKISWQEIKAYNLKRFDIPILKDTAFISGVYFSFEEFRENNPSQRDYEIRKNKLTDLISIKGLDGKMITTRDAWGYCDGKNLFIRCRDNYFRLQRRENAFYTYGSKQYTHKKVAYIPGLGAISNTTVGGPTKSVNPVETTSEHLKLKLKPFELDWETGELK